MMSQSWSLYVIVLTIVSLLGVTWVLFANRTRDAGEDEKTGHSHDGIEEYDNPLPAWWFHMFLITIVFAVGYLIAFPGLGNFPGVLGWSSAERWQNQVDRAEQRYGEVFAAYRQVPVAQLSEDRKAMKMARRMFANNCAQCHGMDARGSIGFPDLTDNDWIFGGEPEQILTSIRNGRIAVMPPWGEVLSHAQV